MCSVDEEVGLSENRKPEFSTGGRSSSIWGLLIQGPCCSSQNHGDKMCPQREALHVSNNERVLTSLSALGNPAAAVKCRDFTQGAPHHMSRTCHFRSQPLTMPQLWSNPLSHSSDCPRLWYAQPPSSERAHYSLSVRPEFSSCFTFVSPVQFEHQPFR